MSDKPRDRDTIATLAALTGAETLHVTVRLKSGANRVSQRSRAMTMNEKSHPSPLVETSVEKLLCHGHGLFGTQSS